MDLVKTMAMSRYLIFLQASKITQDQLRHMRIQPYNKDYYFVTSLPVLPGCDSKCALVSVSWYKLVCNQKKTNIIRQSIDYFLIENHGSGLLSVC